MNSYKSFERANMKILYLILVIVVLVSIFLIVIKKICEKKRSEKFLLFYSNLMKTNELIKAIENYKDHNVLSDYVIEINEIYNNERRTYMKPLNNNMKFGRNCLENDIFICDEEASPIQFCIFLDHNLPFIQSLSKERYTKIAFKKGHGRKTKNSGMLMTNEKIPLFTGDTVSVGNRKFVFTIWNKNKGIR